MATDLSVRGSHVLKIDGYSSISYNRCGFVSGSFHVGGHTWRIGYHPRWELAGSQDFIPLHLYLDAVAPAVAEPIKVRATFSFLGQDLKLKLFHHRYSMVTLSATHCCSYESITRESLARLLTKHQQDCFAVRVDLLVVKQVEEPPSAVQALLPPSDMHQHLGDLLSRNEHTDVEFRVGGETFAAHRLLLGARSPVFKAKFFGPNMKNQSKATTSPTVIPVDDMEPQVFGAMLSFMYTDTWPEMERKQEPEMCQRLLVAADQYGLPRLKVMCERRLCRYINLNSMEGILNLADKHRCAALKEACFDFIGSTATLVLARENLLAMRKTQKARFDRLIALCPAITKDQIFNVLAGNDV